VILLAFQVGSREQFKANDVIEVAEIDLPPRHQLFWTGAHTSQEVAVDGQRCVPVVVRRRLRYHLAVNQTFYGVHSTSFNSVTDNHA